MYMEAFAWGGLSSPPDMVMHADNGYPGSEPC